MCFKRNKAGEKVYVPECKKCHSKRVQKDKKEYRLLCFRNMIKCRELARSISDNTARLEDARTKAGAIYNLLGQIQRRHL